MRIDSRFIKGLRSQAHFSLPGLIRQNVDTQTLLADFGINYRWSCDACRLTGVDIFVGGLYSPSAVFEILVGGNLFLGDCPVSSANRWSRFEFEETVIRPGTAIEIGLRADAHCRDVSFNLLFESL